MSVSEQVGFLDDAIKGHVKVQLFEGDKCVQEAEADNFVGKSLYNWFLALFASTLEDFSTENTQFNTAVASGKGCFTRFVLTDNTNPVPLSANTLPGTVIGYVERKPYAGADTLRGTVNSAESRFFGNNYRVVMDFPSSSANSTFQTLGFVRQTNYPSYATTVSAEDAFFSLPSSSSGSVPNLLSASYTPDFDQSNLTAIGRYDSTRIGVYDLTNKRFKFRQFASTAFSHCCIHDGTICLLNTSDRKIYTLSLSGDDNPVLIGALPSLPSGFSSANHYFKFDGEYLYCMGLQYGARYFSAYSFPSLSAVRTSVSHSAIDSSGGFTGATAIYKEGGKTYFIDASNNRVCFSDFVSTGANGFNYTLVDYFSVASTWLATNHMIGIGPSGSSETYATFVSYSPHFSSSGSVPTGIGLDTERYFIARTDKPYLQNLGTCVVLPTPVTKTSEQTMKITYELTFNFK